MTLFTTVDPFGEYKPRELGGWVYNDLSPYDMKTHKGAVIGGVYDAGLARKVEVLMKECVLENVFPSVMYTLQSERKGRLAKILAGMGDDDDHAILKFGQCSFGCWLFFTVYRQQTKLGIGYEIFYEGSKVANEKGLIECRKQLHTVANRMKRLAPNQATVVKRLRQYGESITNADKPDGKQAQNLLFRAAAEFEQLRLKGYTLVDVRSAFDYTNRIQIVLERGKCKYDLIMHDYEDVFEIKEYRVGVTAYRNTAITLDRLP